MIRNSIKLGTFKGIEIGLDFSWILIFAWVTWSLATHYFPTHYPAWQPAGYWVVAVVTSLFFFGSIVAHELGHSLVALRYHIPVRSITLFIFGGVAQIAKEPKRALEEFLIAIAGPLVSAAIALFFFGLARAVNAPGSPLDALGTWLGVINLSLAVFNLIPGFPLDGGRVFRAAVWALTKDFKRATLTASFLGQLIAYGFIGYGVWIALSGSLMDGLWIGFIGWFLLNAAASSWQQVTIQDVLKGLPASEAMMTDCPHVPRHLPLSELVSRHILKTARRCFPVVEDGHTWGIITLNEIKAVPQDQWDQVTVGRTMIPFQQTHKVAPQTSLAEVLELMTQHEVNQLPVVEGDQLVGMVSREGILRALKTRSELGLG